MARRGGAWQAGRGKARQGKARQARRGGARRGKARQARHGDMSRSIKGSLYLFHCDENLENARGDDSNHLAVPKVIGRVLFG